MNLTVRELLAFATFRKKVQRERPVGGPQHDHPRRLEHPDDLLPGAAKRRRDRLDSEHVRYDRDGQGEDRPRRTTRCALDKVKIDH